MKENPKAFIPGWLDDAGLSKIEFRLYCHLCRRADNTTGIAWPSYQAMIETCGGGKSTIRRSLENLVERGLIKKVGKPFGGSCRYKVNSTIVPPQGLLNANSSTTEPIEPAPIVPPQNRNSPSHGTSIVSPQGQEGNPLKVIQGRLSTLFEEEETIKTGNDLFEYWNTVKELPTIKDITDARKKKLKTRLKSQFFKDNWKAAIDRIKDSSFLLGKGPSGWKADIDWLLQSDSVTKIMEGKYSNGSNNSKPITAPDLGGRNSNDNNETV